MSKRYLSLVRSVPCPYCKAGVGEKCWKLGSKGEYYQTTSSHAQRSKDARDREHLTYVEGAIKG